MNAKISTLKLGQWAGSRIWILARLELGKEEINFIYAELFGLEASNGV
jgi:hypothetical protein